MFDVDYFATTIVITHISPIYYICFTILFMFRLPQYWLTIFSQIH